MGFKKGQSGNIKGKPKGAINKVDMEAKQLFAMILEKQVIQLEKAFAEVYKNDPARYLEIFAKYAQYFIAKKKENEITIIEAPLQEAENIWEISKLSMKALTEMSEAYTSETTIDISKLSDTTIAEIAVIGRKGRIM